MSIEAMKIGWLHNWSEVDHMVDSVMPSLLEQFDAVVVNGYLGVSQYQKYGEQIIVDCRETSFGSQIRSAETGEKMSQILEREALAAGLSVLVCEDFLGMHSKEDARE